MDRRKKKGDYFLNTKTVVSLLRAGKTIAPTFEKGGGWKKRTRREHRICSEEKGRRRRELTSRHYFSGAEGEKEK